MSQRLKEKATGESKTQHLSGEIEALSGAHPQDRSEKRG